MSDIQNNNIAEEEITEQDINILKKFVLKSLMNLKRTMPILMKLQNLM